MEYILGVLAYVFYFIYDFNTIKKNYRILRLFFGVGTFILILTTGYAVYKYWNNDNWFLICSMSSLLLVFLGLLIYTLFFALPFEETYVNKSVERLAYTKGIYGICRHPGMLWLSGVYFCLWGLTNNFEFGYFVYLVVIGDLLYIIYQDYYIFPKTFVNYREYKMTTPFLVPGLKFGKTNNNTPLRRLSKKQIWNKYCSFLDLSVEDFMSIQYKCLEEQLEKWLISELGKNIVANKNININNFREEIKLTNYEDYADILLSKENDKLPEAAEFWIQTTWEGGTKPIKIAPYTRGMLDTFGDNLLSCMVLCSCKKRGMVRAKDNDKILYGLAPLPYLTGLLPELLSRQTNIEFLPPADKAVNMSFSEKNKLGFSMAMKNDVELFFGLGSVAYAVSNSLMKSSGSDIKKLFKCRPHMILRIIGSKIKCKLKKRVVKPKDLFKLKSLVVAGTDNKYYKDELEQLWGVRPFELFAGTEPTLIGTEIWNKNGLYLFPNACFYEFIKLSDVLKNKKDATYIPKTYLFNEVEPNEIYELVLSVFHGGAFMRYRSGDLYKCLRLNEKAENINLPSFEYIDRVPWIIDIAGFTRFTEEEIEGVLEKANLKGIEWLAFKDFTDNNKPFLHMYIEENDNIQIDEIEQNLTDIFLQTDEDFGGLQKILGMNPLKVTVLSKNMILNYRKNNDSFFRVNSFEKPGFNIK